MNFYGQEQVDKYILETFFPNKQDGFFVECGAFDGVIESTCLLFEQYFNWKGINIEPVPYIYNKLIGNRQNSKNIQCALSDHDGTEIFSQAVHPTLGNDFGNGSIRHAPQHYKQLVDCGCILLQLEVPCRKFSTIAKDFPEMPPIDLFVLDVEGYELTALTGILDLKPELMPKVFCIEFPHVGTQNIIDKLGDNYLYHSYHYNNAFFCKTK